MRLVISTHSSRQSSDTTRACASTLTRTYGKSSLSTTRKARSSALTFFTNWASGLPMIQNADPSHSYQTGLTYGHPSRRVPSLAMRPPSVRKAFDSSGVRGGMRRQPISVCRLGSTLGCALCPNGLDEFWECVSLCKRLTPPILAGYPPDYTKFGSDL